MSKLGKNWRNLSCTIDKQAHAIIKTMAEVNRMTMSEVVEDMAHKYVELAKESPKKE